MDYRRILRTLAQAILAGGGVTLLNQVAGDVPVAYSVYVMILGTTALTALQSWADENNIPYPGQRKLRAPQA